MAESTMVHTAGGNRQVSAAQPTPGHLPDDVIDLQGLCDRCMGNLDLVARVLDKFEQRLPEELAELERAVELGDVENIALLAHRIRGSSANVSAAGLQQAAAEVETVSRGGPTDDLRTHVQRLRERWAQYVDCRAQLQSSSSEAAGQR